MASVKLLDCTLRDGGYVNNWSFGRRTILNVLRLLNSSNIDYIEFGFIDDSIAKDINRTIYPSTDAIEEFFKNEHPSRVGSLTHRPQVEKKAMALAMIKFGHCSIENIHPHRMGLLSHPHQQTDSSSLLDGIRVMFKKEQMVDALDFCRQIKEKGYKVFVQPVSVTNYSDEEMLNLVERVNDLNPYALYIVDTYGLLKKEKFINYFNIMNDNLNPEISIGYHSHNNVQLTITNSIELLNFETDREIIWDGSIYGMGKGAGNANTEIFAMYLNHNYGYDYDINELFEIINTEIMPLYTKYNWGYSLVYYLAALNDCHPDYVKFLQEKKSFSVRAMNDILKDLDKSKKLTFDKEHIENLCVSFNALSLK